MSVGRLTDLQARLLRVLAAVTPPWTLTGGAALVGFYAAHRVTRDLDLFWPGLDALGTVPAVVAETLRREGLSVDDIPGASPRSRSHGSSTPFLCGSSRRASGARRARSTRWIGFGSS